MQTFHITYKDHKFVNTKNCFYQHVLHLNIAEFPNTLISNTAILMYSITKKYLYYCVLVATIEPL